MVELGIFGAVIFAFVVCGCILTPRSTKRATKKHLRADARR
jgi:hypothetical protein